MATTDPMEMGTQPLDALMEQLGLKNSDLVEHSTEQLTFKMIAKGRKGRRLSLNSNCIHAARSVQL